jgi:Hydantoinase/oxoprolinase N-terminal region
MPGIVRWCAKAFKGDGSLDLDSSEICELKSLAFPIIFLKERKRSRVDWERGVGRVEDGFCGRKFRTVPNAFPADPPRSAPECVVISSTPIKRPSQYTPAPRPHSQTSSLPGSVKENDMSSEKIKIAIDRGGTFTDCIGSFKGKEEIVKLLSVDPNNYDDAPLEGIRRLLEKFTDKKIDRKDKLDTSLIG